MATYGVKLMRRDGRARYPYEGSLLGFCTNGDWNLLDIWTTDSWETALCKAFEMQECADRYDSNVRYVATPLPCVEPQKPAVDGESVPAATSERTTAESPSMGTAEALCMACEALMAQCVATRPDSAEGKRYRAALATVEALLLHPLPTVAR